jgi:CRP/FNR family cyclic AMP-dependent transcriptional regulator
VTSRDYALRTRPAAYEDAVETAIRRSFFRQFPARIMSELGSDALRVDVPAGSELYHENDEPRSSLVVSGLVRVYIQHPNGSDVSVRYARTGDVIGIAAIYGGPAPVNVRMITDATLLMFNADTLARIAKSTPSIGWILAEEITRRYYDTLELVGGDAAGSIRQRIARFVLENATVQQGQTILSPITRRELAAAIGAVPPVTMRALRDLRTKGLIATGRRGILVIDPEGLHLEALASER